MCCLLVASAPLRAEEAHREDEPLDAIEIFQCGFDDPWDQNYDLWPDRWIRATGVGYPHYVDIKIHDDGITANAPYLRIDLDGASAAVTSPPIRVMSRFSYALKAKLKTSNLERSEVTLSVQFYDSSGKLMQTESRQIDTRSDRWQSISLSSLDPNDVSIDRAVIRLEVARGLRGDLSGTVLLDEVSVARLPRITVSTNRPYNVYGTDEDVVVRCELSGILEQNPEIRFQLLDASNRQLNEESHLLAGRLIVEDRKSASDIVDGVGIASKGYEGQTEWRPKIHGHGYYQVVVTMSGASPDGATQDDVRKTERRVIWFAVVPPLPMPAKGDFGWSLHDADDPLSFSELSELLPKVGINWAKVPVWYNAGDPQRGDTIIRFVEMLAASHIDVVGMIDRPPADSDFGKHMGAGGSICEVLSADPNLWMPLLDPVMSRLSMRLRYWQLGNDHDTSFVGDLHLGKRIDELRERLFRFGQEVRMGMVWAADGENQSPRRVTWEFEQLTPDPALDLTEFETLVSRPRNNSLLRWIAVEPPPCSEVADSTVPAQRDARVTLFVRKIIAAKMHGADGIFVPNPFNDQNGLMRSNGMPGEMLLPWRTCATMLSGAQYLGTIQLPNGSENCVFRRNDGQVVMAVWNDEPTQESLYLGEGIQLIDILGGDSNPVVVDGQQLVDVGPLPKFVLGLHEPIARWRMSMHFEQDHVESIFAKPHPNAVHFANFFPQGVGGTMTIVAPQASASDAAGSEAPSEHPSLDSDLWSIDPPEGSFGLAAGEEVRFPFEIQLKNAIFGEQPVRVDFVVDAEADEPYRFSVYRTMWVGTGDISIQLQTHLDGDGSLVVEQFMTNQAERLVDFKCYLFAKGHRRQRAQVYRLGSTPDRTVYRYPNGAELVGKELLLEAEEIGGERVLKYRFIATEQVPTDESTPADDSPESKAGVPDASTT